MLYKIIFILMLFTLIASCDNGMSSVPKQYKMSDLIGVYKAKWLYGVGTLILNADGSYIQQYKPDDNNEIEENKGEWKISGDKPDDTNLVYFKDMTLYFPPFLFFRKDRGEITKGWSCGYAINQSKQGKIIIILNSDYPLDMQYIKDK